jgi:hypothetical protein
MWAELPTTTERQLQYLEKQKEVGRFFYDHLSIIDFKASCLLIVDSILLAILAIVVDKVPQASSTHGLVFIVNVAKWVGVLAVLISIALALLVVWLHWFSLDDLIDLAPAGAKDAAAANRAAAVDRKFALLNKRTLRYRFAWVFAFISLLPIVGLMLLHIYESNPN